MYAHRRDGGARLISSLHTSPDARACASSVYRPRRRRHTRAERSLCIWACRAPLRTLEHKSKCFFFEDFEPHLPFKQQRRQPALSPETERTAASHCADAACAESTADYLLCECVSRVLWNHGLCAVSRHAPRPSPVLGVIETAPVRSGGSRTTVHR